MCGIVGYIGTQQAQPLLISGLERLEYRGYDSAGISVLENGTLTVQKVKGKLQNLKNLLEQHPCRGTIGIGHTRWATHGEPLDINSHPHIDNKGKIAVIHNGIIENYLELKQWLTEQGCEFCSQTDTEVVAHLLSVYYDGDMLSTLQKALPKLKGAYALGILTSSEPDTLYCARQDSPLIIGLQEDGVLIASDIPAILEHTREILMLENGEIGLLTREGAQLYTVAGERVERESNHIDWNIETAEKCGYEHFMLKEIHEQPKAYQNTLSPLIQEEDGIVFYREELAPFTQEEFSQFEQVTIIACGTAYHAGLVGKALMERILRIPVSVQVASEFRYSNPIVRPNTLFIAVSQSGETADTIAAIREAKRLGGVVLAITNVVGCTVAREADKVIHTWAGLEIAVASTKAYTSQLMVLYVLTAIMAVNRGVMTREEASDYFQLLQDIPRLAEQELKKEPLIQESARRFYEKNQVFFLGRTLDYFLAKEGSLKLKEISYIHSESYAAGELKHGTIALIEDGTLVIALVTQRPLVDKMLSNMEEVRVRGAHVLAVAMEDNEKVRHVAEETWTIPVIDDLFTPLLSILPLQLFAYYVALEKGCDIDKPRNLAKSVTVE